MIFSEADVRRIVRGELRRHNVIPMEDGMFREPDDRPVQAEELVEPYKRKHWWSF